MCIRDSYNYGALLFNKGVEIFNKANKLPPTEQAEYENLKKVYESLWHQSLPLLEKALTIQPDDIPTLYTCLLYTSNPPNPPFLKGEIDRRIHIFYFHLVLLKSMKAYPEKLRA